MTGPETRIVLRHRMSDDAVWDEYGHQIGPDVYSELFDSDLNVAADAMEAARLSALKQIAPILCPLAVFGQSENPRDPLFLEDRGGFPQRGAGGI